MPAARSSMCSSATDGGWSCSTATGGSSSTIPVADRPSDSPPGRICLVPSAGSMLNNLASSTRCRSIGGAWGHPNMAKQKFRLVTRSDFDGLVCAVLLKELELIDEIKFVHPKDM